MSDDKDWIKAIDKPVVRCLMCKDKMLVRLNILLTAIKDAKTHISMDKIYNRLCELDGGFKKRVGSSGFKKHLKHEEIWRQIETFKRKNK